MKVLDTLVRVAIVAVVLATLSACGDSVPNIGPKDSTLPSGEAGELIKQGRRIANNTAQLLKQHDGNGMRCSSCHFYAGTLPDGGAWVRVQAQDEQALTARINRCLVESMNGKPMPADMLGMRALRAYIGWLGTAKLKPEEEPAARGFGPVDASLTPDPTHGAALYTKRCALCHGDHGEGSLNEPGRGGYKYPPLWGPHAISAASEMNQLPMAAALVKNNMPRTRSHALTAQEAVDVSSYVIAQPRPAAAH
ncbi:MAG: c-type cytochrome [Burkholderiaceae bacterium]|nr:c-type cytochrome [Burkholderiaceae bacterium]